MSPVLYLTIAIWLSASMFLFYHIYNTLLKPRAIKMPQIYQVCKVYQVHQVHKVNIIFNFHLPIFIEFTM